MIQIKRHNLDKLAQEHCDALKDKLKANLKKAKEVAKIEAKSFWDCITDDTIEILLKGKKEELKRVCDIIESVNKPFICSILYE